ncbi:hypothetical protein MJO28_002030 [Puccinia striiformis f. sp. tritici]|uniref:SUN domain-containing protein n=3 Tax=Puccinia striiformis TaxID=27350 RepID=A0A2S4URU1_9BASI|nr:hypothetical protein MJO28_002030 [Puccinia striiformis f. sp. tritici]POV99927.1 hypothetical protein PSHT_13321 [Puccinia striiformis]POW04858.1 hypothetical protein PSTT_10112 [Puccinia striiformis]
MSIDASSAGTIGKKAAIGWKCLRQRWCSISAVLIVSLFFTIIIRKQSSLNEKIILLNQRLQGLEDLGLKTVDEINYLIGSTKDVVKRTEFEEGLLQVEHRWQIIYSQENHGFPAKDECKGSTIYPKKDFASYYAGASIVENLTSPTWSYELETHPSKFPFYKNIQKISGSPPLTVLLSDLNLGVCWPFHGTTGQISIQLSRTIWVEGITIGHVSRSLAYDIRTAPKQFELWGLDPSSHEDDENLLLEGTYSIDGLENVQQFLAPKIDLQPYSQVLFKIKSNHGNPDLTCLYRVQVHGKWEDKHEGYSSNHMTPT